MSNNDNLPFCDKARRAWLAEQLFHAQAVTISKTGDVIRLGCESLDDAEVLWQWLDDLVG